MNPPKEMETFRLHVNAIVGILLNDGDNVYNYLREEVLIPEDPLRFFQKSTTFIYAMIEAHLRVKAEISNGTARGFE